ncbi:hypothetical protein [Microbacterium sp. NIBRBAC000506063]|uniref:hypothetical protein n=1 Tax=Microbacterium sp. NIBRBAC000506063 TaxID=2734618 RepID=UPI001CB7154B|nr:hypothetical protein [Microbacterium sp. NIBRBAC000506063]
MRVKLSLRRPAAPLTDVLVMADSTATVSDVAHQIAEADPLRSIPVAPGEVLTLAVAPPTSDQPVMLNPDLLVGDAPIGSGFLAEVTPPAAGPGDGRRSRARCAHLCRCRARRRRRVLAADRALPDRSRCRQ